MNTSYFSILKDLALEWDKNLSLEIRREYLKPIIHNRWIVANTTDYGLIDYLSLSGLGLIGMIHQNRTWFVDFGKEYRKFSQYEKVVGSPRRIDIRDKKIICNYNVFGGVHIEPNKVNYLTDGSLLYVCGILDVNYVIEVYTFFAEEDLSIVGFDIKEADFTLKGIYLSHEIYDEGKSLTLKFVYKIMRLMMTISALLKKKLDLNIINEIDTAESLINLIEKEILIPAFGNKYKQTDHIEDVKTRLKIINQNLERLTRKTK